MLNTSLSAGFSELFSDFGCGGHLTYISWYSEHPTTTTTSSAYIQKHKTLNFFKITNVVPKIYASGVIDLSFELLQFRKAHCLRLHFMIRCV